MFLRSCPAWIRDHLSFRRIDSVCRSVGDISGLILGRELVSAKSADTSMTLLNFTKRGQGQFEFAWHFPSRARSQKDKGLMLLSTLAII